MSIPWGMIKEKKAAPARQAVIKSLFTSDRYGKGKDSWSLTELATARTSESALVLRMLEGAGLDGRRDPDNALKDSTGREFVFRLRVLTRQACSLTKDGWAINQRSASVVEDDPDERMHAATADEKPQPGDIVKVKGNFRWHDPETGDLLLSSARMALQSRVEGELGRSIKPHDATYHWTDYTVDKDGCITVPFLHALQLLLKRGKRVVNPQFRRGDPPDQTGTKPRARKITNWHFEEVLPERAEKAATK